MAESTEFTDEMLEQVVGGNIYDSQEEYSAYFKKLRVVIDKLGDKYGTDKVLQVTVFNKKYKNLITADNSDELLEDGTIERELDAALSEL